MPAKDVLKNINCFVDGRGYAGQIEDLNPPDLTLMTEEFRGGGMDAPDDIDMGMEKMATSFSFISYDMNILSLFGVAQGSTVPLVFRAVLESFDGSTKAVKITQRGKITKIARGAWKAGEKATLTVEMTLTMYQEEHDGNVIYDIDIDNMKRVINGVDRLAQQRAALGI